MEIPASVQTRKLEQLYNIPSSETIDETIHEEFEIPRPDPIASGVFTDKVKIQKLGSERWVLVYATPSEVWPKVRYFKQ